MPKQDVALEVYYDGAWHDLVVDDDVLSRAPIVIRRGQGDESTALRPAELTATLANDDDRYRTSNPESPLYGKAGRNTPARVLVDGQTRGVFEASSWECGQSRDFRRYPRRGSAWTTLTAGGILQRVAQWTQPLKSAFRAYNDTLVADGGLLAYFPAEQNRADTDLVSAVPGSKRIAFRNATFESRSRPASSAPVLEVSDQAEVVYSVPPNAGSTDGYQFSWIQRLEELVAGEQRIMSWVTNSPMVTWTVFLDSTTEEIRLVGERFVDGVQIVNSAVSYGTFDWTGWALVSIDAQETAGTTQMWVNWTNENADTGFMNPTYSGTPASPLQFSFRGGDEEMPDGSAVGHIMLAAADSSGGVDLFSLSRRRAFYAYVDDDAAVRFDRLCNEQNDLESGVSGNWALTMRMGPQPIAPLIQQFEECVRTDDALIYDNRVAAQVTFVGLYDRYNQDPAVELTPADLPVLPPEVVDDLPVHNVVTVVRADGLQATARDDTGPLGTQAPPDGVGEYLQRVDVNPADDAEIEHIANWWLRRGTVDLPRYPQVTVNLAALPAGLRAQVAAVDVGNVITITGFRENTIRLWVVGYTETIGTHSRSIVFTTAPDAMYDVGVWDGDRRYDSATSTISAVDAATGTWTISTTDAAQVWSTTATPYDLIAAGERVTCTSMGAVSGTGPYVQTATVTRSRNGIRKPHTAGTPVRVATPGRWGLGRD